jgi:hypothetical protein
MKRKIKPASKVLPVYERICHILESAKTSVAQSVNTMPVISYWMIGREIVEEEQKGQKRAGYGKELLQSLSERLTSDFGSGFSVHNLKFIRQFYMEYPRLAGDSEIGYAVRSQSSANMDRRIGHAVRDQSRALVEISDAARRKSGITLEPAAQIHTGGGE